jgi:hypothetical protein
MLEIKGEKRPFPRSVDRVANYNKIVVQYRQRKGWRFSIYLGGNRPPPRIITSLDLETVQHSLGKTTIGEVDF